MSKIERKVINWLGNEVDFENQLCIGDGWKPLVRKLYDDLVACGWDRELRQCKEKYGGLRFYIGSATDGQWELIRDAEEASLHTCEFCGEAGSLRVSYGWYFTACDEHASGRDKVESE